VFFKLLSFILSLQVFIIIIFHFRVLRYSLMSRFLVFIDTCSKIACHRSCDIIICGTLFLDIRLYMEK